MIRNQIMRCDKIVAVDGAMIDLYKENSALEYRMRCGENGENVYD